MLPMWVFPEFSCLHRSMLGLHRVKIFGSEGRDEICCWTRRQAPAEADFHLGALSQKGTIPPTAANTLN